MFGVYYQPKQRKKTQRGAHAFDLHQECIAAHAKDILTSDELHEKIMKQCDTPEN